MNRKYNFCSGPCCLPEDVMKQAQEQFVNYHDTGLSLLEMSHRGEHYTRVHMLAMDLLRKILNVPQDFSIILMQGGATIQYPLVPMNLLGTGDKTASYLNSGIWAKKAINDAASACNVNVCWDGKEHQYRTLPKDASQLDIAKDAQYLYICANETIGGLQFDQFPNVDIPLVADMSSEIMTRPIDWDRFDLVYAGLQKNMAPSGGSVVIVRTNKLSSDNKLPAYFDYLTHIKNDSLLNTPPSFCIWMLSLMLEWVVEQGGLEAMSRATQEKSSILYDVIDGSDGYYQNFIDPSYRSRMNVVFRLRTEELEKRFLDFCKQKGFENLEGHRSVGGLRASIYNGMPIKGVSHLAEAMLEFKKKQP